MKVYKYFNYKYKTSAQLGFVYINTFDMIRKGEKNGSINDATELSTSQYAKDVEVDSLNPEHQQTIKNLKYCGINVGEEGQAKIMNSFFNHQANAYMYCVTAERNDTYWSNIEEEQGGPYEGCIEIPDFKAFSRQLYDSLRYQDKMLQAMKVDKVFFESNKGSIDDNKIIYLDYFRKPSLEVYKQQQELRIVIESGGSSLIPQSIYISPKYFTVL